MTHHWRPSDGLIAGPRPGGEWFLYDRSRLVGTIQHGRVAKKQAFRSVTPDGDLVGYAWTLEAACDRLWAWHILVETGGEHVGMAVATHSDQ